jgi:hypothetical protein
MRRATGSALRHPGAVGMSWTLIRHVPSVLMVLPWEMPSDATDVELYGESDCGEEIHLELLDPAGAHEGPGRKSRSMPQLAAWRQLRNRPAADWMNRRHTVSRAPG